MHVYVYVYICIYILIVLNIFILKRRTLQIFIIFLRYIFVSLPWKDGQGQGHITEWANWAFARNPQICKDPTLFIKKLFLSLPIYFLFFFFLFEKKNLYRKLDLILNYTRNYEFSPCLLKYYLFPLLFIVYGLYSYKFTNKTVFTNNFLVNFWTFSIFTALLKYSIAK